MNFRHTHFHIMEDKIYIAKLEIILGSLSREQDKKDRQQGQCQMMGK